MRQTKTSRYPFFRSALKPKNGVLSASQAEPARAMEPSVHLSVQICFVSKYNSEPPHIPSSSRCILRSCVIRPHAHRWPGAAGSAGQAAPTHIFRRCPPGCAHASGLLPTPPRENSCEPALCVSFARYAVFARHRPAGHRRAARPAACRRVDSPERSGSICAERSGIAE